jgi:hypothetical protein
MRLLSSGSVTSVQSSDLFLAFEEEAGVSDADDERALMRDDDGIVSGTVSVSASGSAVVTNEYDRRRDEPRLGGGGCREVGDSSSDDPACLAMSVSASMS